MAYPTKITQLAQSVYLTVKNRHIDDIADDEGQEYISRVIDWGNLLFDELENISDSAGRLVNWLWLRQQDYEISTGDAGERIVDLDDGVLSVVGSEDRPIKIVDEDGKVLSSWVVVSPDQLGSVPGKNSVAQVGQSLYFSRAFNEREDGADIIGDVTLSIPRMVNNIYDALDIVPRQLLVLGIAKNSVLPDIVQGGLTPSYIQKYNDLVQSSIVRNNASSSSSFSQRDDNSYIGGVGF